MAKIIFNNKNYNIDESALSSAVTALKSHLSTTMSGSGATINLDGVDYNVDATKLQSATNDFVSHLGKIAGSGSKVTIGGVEYSVDSNKVADAVTEIEALLEELNIEIKYTNFIVTQSNRAKVGYTGAEGETLIIPATFQDPDDGIWYKVTSIDEYAFQNCTGLTSVTIPDTVTSIGHSAFYGCARLTDLTISSAVQTIDTNAFAGYVTTTVNYTGTLEQWCNINFTAITSNPCYNGADLYIGGVKQTDITIPDSVTSIGQYAFYGCNSLTSVTIGSGVQTIGREAFTRCKELKSATIGSGVQTIGSSAFSGCTGLTNVIIENGVNSVTYGMFQNCTGLTSVTIPASVTYIDMCAFYNTRLANVYYTGTEEQWGNITIETNNNKLTNATIHYNYQG